MSRKEIIRAWRSEEYWLSLSEEERARLPENPAGMVELDDVDLSDVAGGVVETMSLLVECASCNSCQCHNSANCCW